MIGISPGARQRLVIATATLVLAVYAQTLSFPFHFDDYALLSDPYITASDGLWRMFRLEQTRPLTYFTFWLNYRLGGANPWGYHAFNVGLHLAAMLAAAAVFRRILAAGAALIAAAVFALHPLQTEAVAYVFGRAIVLATLFCLLAWRDWLDGRSWRAVLWFSLGVLAKEECVAFPVFLLLFERGRRWRPWAAMVAISGAAGLRLLLTAGRAAGTGLGLAAGVTPGEYLLTQAKVIWRYLLLFVSPIGQNFDHHIQSFSAGDVAWIVALAGLAALAVWKRRLGGVWILGALVLLAPSSSIVPLADLMFEHRMYLPLASLAAGVGLVLGKVRWPLPVLLILALAWASWARTAVWRSEESLWADAAAKSPGKVRPKLQLARAVAGRDPQRAASLLLDARRLDPRNLETYTLMGTLLLDQRNPAAALAEFEDALRLAPDSADAHSNRGTALYLLGKIDEAEIEFRAALELAPCHVNAWHNLRLLRPSEAGPGAGCGPGGPPH